MSHTKNTFHIEKNTTQKQTKSMFKTPKNSPFGIALVYNNNKAGTCGYRGPLTV